MIDHAENAKICGEGGDAIYEYHVISYLW